MTPQPGFTAFLGAIPSGSAGVNATLKLMVSIARKTRTSLPVRTLAQQLVQNCPQQDDACEATALHSFVRDSIRYVRDIRDTETVQFPEQTLQLGSGDCDDKSLLLSALAESIGFATRFCAVRIGADTVPTHVSPQILIRGQGWVNAEVIPIDGASGGAPLGWFPQDATCFRLAHV
jgi:Transglutaminase-like superfamily